MVINPCIRSGISLWAALRGYAPQISTMEHVSYDFIVDSDFQKKSCIVSDFLVEPALHPCYYIIIILSTFSENVHPDSFSSPQAQDHLDPTVYVKQVVINGQQQTVLVDCNNRQVATLSSGDTLSHPDVPLPASPVSICNVRFSLFIRL